MSIQTLSMIGGFGSLVALVIIAIFALRTNDEPPQFVYLVGVVLAVAAIVLFRHAGLR